MAKDRTQTRKSKFLAAKWINFRTATISRPKNEQRIGRGLLLSSKRKLWIMKSRKNRNRQIFARWGILNQIQPWASCSFVMIHETERIRWIPGICLICDRSISNNVHLKNIDPCLTNEEYQNASIFGGTYYDFPRKVVLHRAMYTNKKIWIFGRQIN